MTTAAWLTLVGIVAVAAFLAGYRWRCEVELGRRVTGRTIEFDRKRIGA